MNAYNNGFYSVMHDAGILSNASFEAYLSDVVGYGNTQALSLEGFNFEPDMQLTFDYEQLQLENRIAVMATYTDKDSEAIPFGTKGFTTSRGSIPRQKARFIMDEHDLRIYLDAQARLSFQNMSAKDYALNLLFNKMTDITNAHNTSMTYQRDQMVSAGKVTLTDANNPRGIRGVTFTASIPTGNVTTLATTKRWFTDTDPNGATYKTVEGADSDPVSDVKNVIKAMRRKGFANITIEVDEVSFLEDMEHSKWRTAFGFLLNPVLMQDTVGQDTALWVGRQMLDDQVKDAFRRITGCNVIFRNNIAAVEKIDPTTKELVRSRMRSFNQNTYVFYPSGAPLGTIKTVAPLLPDESAMYGRILSGKGIIQYEYDAKTKVQDWWSELTCLCVPNRSKEMFYLNTLG